MQQPAQIGPSVVIKGDISASEPISIAGRVEGRIEVQEHGVTIAPGAHVEGDVVANHVVVAGTLQGTLTADSRIVLRGTASLEGEISAPSISVEDGAFLRGKVAARGNRPELAHAS